jgi:hypothetical protein
MMANGHSSLGDDRRPYVRPELHAYGAMREITRGGAGASPEGTTGKAANKRP